MASKSKTATKASAGKSVVPDCEISVETKKEESLLSIVNMMIQRIGTELRTGVGEKGLRTLAADLLKLVALQKELGGEEVREVTVRWIANKPESPVND